MLGAAYEQLHQFLFRFLMVIFHPRVTIGADNVEGVYVCVGNPDTDNVQPVTTS